MADKVHSTAPVASAPLETLAWRPLRLGLILRGDKLPAWQAWLLRELLRLQVKIPIVLCHSDMPNAMSRAPLFWSWRMVDRALSNRSENYPDPLAPSDVRQLLGQAQWIEVGRCDESLPPEGPKKLAASSLDIVLQFGCERVHEEVCREAQLSLWFCRLSGRLGASGDLAVLSSMVTQAPLESTVEELDASGCEVRRRSVTHLISHSLYRSQARAYWKLASLLLQELRDLTTGREGANKIRSATMAPPIGRSAAATPGTGALITGVGRRVASRVMRRSLGHDSWVIGIRRRRCWTAADYYAVDLSGFVTLPCAATGFRADPFLVEHDGRHFIFFEEFRYATRKGIIACMEVFDNLQVAEPRVVLERPYHLAYPFVIRGHDELFMIPDSARNGTVELYRCVDFPERWVLDTVLLEGFAGIDSTVVKRDGRFWLFSCRHDSQSDTTDDLYIFWATSLRGPWRPHELNPVLSDVRCARAAGQFFEADGQLFRPSQDGSKRYGWRINLSRVLRLSDVEYKEDVVDVVDDRWSRRTEGAHTWNADSKFEVIDGPTWSPRWTVWRADCGR